MRNGGDGGSTTCLVHAERRREDGDVVAVRSLDPCGDDVGVGDVGVRRGGSLHVPRQQRSLEHLESRALDAAAAARAEILVCGVEPSGGRVTVDDLAARRGKSVSPPARRCQDHVGVDRHAVRGPWEQGQGEPVVSAQHPDSVEGGDDDVLVGELRERGRRVVERRVDRRVGERAANGQDHAFGPSSLREVVMCDGDAGAARLGRQLIQLGGTRACRGLLRHDIVRWRVGHRQAPRIARASVAAGSSSGVRQGGVGSPPHSARP